MIADSHNIALRVGSRPIPSWADAWHLWKIIVPRRSITGRLVWGTVWRRRNGRRWSYKKFIEYSDEGDVIDPARHWRSLPAPVAILRCARRLSNLAHVSLVQR